MPDAAHVEPHATRVNPPYMQTSRRIRALSSPVAQVQRVFCRCFALAGAVVASVAPSLLAQNPKNVLVLHDGNANYPANIIFSAALHKTFVPETRYQIFEDYVDEPRLNGSEDQLADIFAKKYAGKKMDLVITEG